MRDLFSKLTIGTMVAGAALLVSACGGTETANAVDNTTVTDLNAVEPAGETNDSMTAIDGTTGNDVIANETIANEPVANATVGNETAK